MLADGKIYFTTRGGSIHVFEAGTKFKQLAVNRLTSEREDFSATPAISQGELFFRSSKHLYCVAELGEGDEARSAALTEPEETAPEESRPTRDRTARNFERPASGGGFGGRGGRGGRQPESENRPERPERPEFEE